MSRAVPVRRRSIPATVSWRRTRPSPRRAPKPASCSSARRPPRSAPWGTSTAKKAVIERAGVPLVPGYHGDAQDLPTLDAAAARIGYPVLIKASAGGGGKGMRIVDRPDDLAASIEGAKREA